MKKKCIILGRCCLVNGRKVFKTAIMRMKSIDDLEVRYKLYSDGIRYWLKDGELKKEEP